MGGAGGHMWHPFDCPDVNSGQDLISFFQRSIESIKRNPAALKIDGVNLSFRLREDRGAPSGYEFVIDRGSMKPLDVEGVTADNADQRFVTKDGSPHGMVEATRILLDIFNAAVPEILPELQQLGMTENTGPFSLYFNTEFVLKKINVKEYPFNFIAIHGVNKFVKKGPKSRKGVGVKANQAILDQIKEKVQTFANERDFRVYTSIPANIKNSILLEDSLNAEFTIVYKSFAEDPEEPGELGAGEGSTKSLKVWLADVLENPVNKKVNISEKMRKIYPNMGRSQTPYAKNIYLEVLKGTAVSDIADGPEDVEAIVDAVIVMHSTRILGNAVLDALESDEFGSAREQEGVVVSDPEICGGTSFKFTGDFIVGGLASTFEEAKFKKGNLLKEFDENRQYIILIPGGFKPPTGGHYHMIKHYDKRDDVRKIFVITGTKAREGVTLQQSKQIFDVYGGFSDKVEFMPSDDPTPLRTCYELMQNENFVNQFPNSYFSIGAGDKGGDPKRIEGFSSYFNNKKSLTQAKIAIYPPAPSLQVNGQPASASRLRKAYRAGDWKTFKDLLPDDNFYDDVVQILNDQGGAEVNENFLLATSRSFLVEKMTKKQKDEKEDIVMGMKKKKADFKKRYGKDWKKVMYATATKHAMSEEVNAEYENKLRDQIKMMLGNIAVRIPELSQSTPEEKANLMDPLVGSVLAQLVQTIASVSAKPVEKKDEDETEEIVQKMDEVSAMAAGAVAGGGNAWIRRRKENE